jgi:hypothetical protein
MITTLKDNIIREQAARGVKASGRSARSLRKEVTDSAGRLYGLYYFLQQEQGRGPTRTLEPSTPTLRERIFSWLGEKGINPTDITKESLAYVIARKIHNEGTKLYRKLNKGEANDAVKVGIEDGINAVIKQYKPELVKKMSISLRSQIVKDIK